MSLQGCVSCNERQHAHQGQQTDSYDLPSPSLQCAHLTPIPQCLTPAILLVMSTLAPLIEAWDEGHREFAIALEDLPSEDLWKRPHPRLLSVGELAAHIAYGQAIWTLGDGNPKPDLQQLSIKSPLVTNAFRYYTTNVDAPVALDLTTNEVHEEVMRVHEIAKAAVVGKSKDDPYPAFWGTWGNMIMYQAFHVAYHTGQAYSVRHLLGHETEDN